MTYQLTISPDFSPVHLPGWHIFNTWLQKKIEAAIHLELYDSFQSQREAIENDKVDIIYANPYDASMLVREKGFVPLVCPLASGDEAIIAVSTEHPAQSVEELQPGLKLSSTDDPDIHMMGMIMLEPADLNESNISRNICDSYVLVAKALIRGESDIGFFLAESYDDFSSMIRKQLRILVQSQIQVIHHSLLLGPRLAVRREEIRQALLTMTNDPKGTGVLNSLGITGWKEVGQEDMEFMIDLMSTLVE